MGFALYRLGSEGELFDISRKTPEKFFGASGLRLSRNYNKVTADPFLFSDSDRLYAFYEVCTDFGKGEIWAHSMGKDGNWVEHGQVLAEPFHLSFPCVFRGRDGAIYMLPETASSGHAWLYVADEFPLKWRRLRVLLVKPLKDPAIIETAGGALLLGTNLNDQLECHASQGLHAEFDAIGQRITDDKAVSRNAGAFFSVAGKCYRPAQYGVNFYGEKVGIMEVDLDGPAGYREHLVIADLFPSKPKWMALGCHHVSIAHFDGACFVVVDGRRHDSYVNTLLLAWFKLMETLRVGWVRVMARV